MNSEYKPIGPSSNNGWSKTIYIFLLGTWAYWTAKFGMFYLFVWTHSSKEGWAELMKRMWNWYSF